MEIEDVIRHMIKFNVNKKSRKQEYTFQRMYLYAILFHIHGWSLQRIGNLFTTTNKKGEEVPRDHATIRNALIEAHHVQHRDDFQKETSLIQEQFYFIIPEYKGAGAGAKKKDIARYEVSVELSKEKYINYLKSKDINVIYDIVWQLTLEKIRSNIKQRYSKL